MTNPHIQIYSDAQLEYYDTETNMGGYEHISREMTIAMHTNQVKYDCALVRTSRTCQPHPCICRPSRRRFGAQLGQIG